ncbi:TetR/AcrR family transcriptional regulator [Sphingomonas sp.]|uniref:TetR/AcrR family transcriptional regulator n=1 Tax=Sphingomonas sp. TaxID=28214 RepID=UPI003CC67D68
MRKSIAPKGASRVPRAGRPSTALITREAAAKAALAVIDESGLEALSLQSVAKTLGVSAPSLYHHFSNKEELLTQIARALLVEIGREQERWSGDWNERMIELSLATRRVMLRHPNAAPLVLRFFPRQVMLQAYENAIVDCPYPVEVRMVINELVEHMTYGASLFAAAAEAHHIPVMPIVDEERFPNLAQAIRAGEQDAETRFVEGLRTVLAGFQARFGQGG